jgi:histidyl-tRNA synthetase
MPPRAPAGTEDVLPERIADWRRVETAAREVLERCGYREIRTPVFEYTGLFARSIGDATDIVEKEMYTIPRSTAHGAGAAAGAPDAAGDDEDTLTLRPELTASVVRAYLEHGMHKSRPFQKFYYLGPLFRRERPQKGRLRQFHQVGIEAIGSRDPLMDVETIDVFVRFLDAAGVAGSTVNLNSTGCRECRGGYREKLSAHLRVHAETLCENCRRRLDRNVFRVLDCKVKTCQPAIAGAPPIAESLCPACAAHFGAVQEGLKAIGVPFAVNPRLVRGLDYYTKTVYEVTSPHLGAQSAVGGGGRYDDLVAELGGPPTGAVGFAIGLERVLIAREAAEAAARKGAAAPGGPAPAGAVSDVYVVAVEEAQRAAAFRLLAALRTAGVRADMDYDARSLKGQMRSANRAGARIALVLGPDEAATGTVQLKDMAKGEQRKLPVADVAAEARRILAGA